LENVIMLKFFPNQFLILRTTISTVLDLSLVYVQWS
jgi:hypothetical protein